MGAGSPAPQHRLPQAAPFSLTIGHVRSGLVFTLVGELDVTVRDGLRRAGRRVARRYEAGELTFDCRALTFLDARGVDAMLAVVDAAPPGSRALVIGATPTMRKLFDVLGAFDHLRLDEDPLP